MPKWNAKLKVKVFFTCKRNYFLCNMHLSIAYAITQSRKLSQTLPQSFEIFLNCEQFFAESSQEKSTFWMI